jgi:hypothetical protein
MAQVKFYRGVRANYSSVTHADGIYFATDTHVIIMNNVEYGVSSEDIEAIKGAVDGVTLTDPSTLTFSFVDETAHPDLTVKLVSYAAAANGGLEFGTPDPTTKVSEVSIKLNPNDKVLTLGSTGLLANLGLSYDSTNKLIKLTGKDIDDGQGGTAPAVLAQIDATDFIKDGMIDSVELVTDPAGQPAGTYIKITFNTAAGKDPIFLNVTGLIDVYTAGNGLQLSGSEFSIKLADDNEGTYLQVGAGGLKITGIAAIKTQVDNIIASVGLGASEAYVNTGTYIGKETTNTVTSDIKALDTAAAGKADKVASATAGNFAGLDANGNLTDSGAKASDFEAAGTAAGLIADLDATPSQAAGADGLALSLTEVDGVVTAISGSIAANTYDAYGDAAAVLGQSTDAYTDNTVFGAKKYTDKSLEWNEVTA